MVKGMCAKFHGKIIVFPGITEALCPSPIHGEPPFHPE